MGASGFIASKISTKGRLAMVCVAVSFLVMIVAVAVSSGFRTEIRNGISDVSGDVQLIPISQDYISENSSIGRTPDYLPHIEELPQVQSVNPVVYRAGLIRHDENIHGVLFKGVENPADTASLAVSIPRRLSTMLGLEVGDDMTTYFISDRVKARKFHVASVYDGLVDSQDKLVIIASMDDMQRLNGWDEDEISAFEIKVHPAFRTKRMLSEIEQEVGFISSSYLSDDDDTVYASSSISSYPQMFDWLDLIDFNVVFILILMTIVAGFNMISGLLIMLFENISTIGLLKALGMKDRDISKVFLISSSKIVLKGMFAGNLLAILFCIIQSTTHLLKLPPQNYFVSFVPVHLNIGVVLAADLISYAVIMALLLVPTLFISKVDPADTVRMN